MRLERNDHRTSTELVSRRCVGAEERVHNQTPHSPLPFISVSPVIPISSLHKETLRSKLNI